MGERPNAITTSVPTPKVSERVDAENLKTKWGKTQEGDGAYTFGHTAVHGQVYSISTPPPTVLGSLYVDHVFSYIHTGVITHFQHMTGKVVPYPVNWDDNGLPTEYRVQNYYDVRVDPSLPYVEDFIPPHEGGEGESIKAYDRQPISRRNFVELYERLTVEGKTQFRALWRYLGLSVGWKQSYQTTGRHARKIARAVLLRNLERGEAYQSEALSLWDITFRTAVAQAGFESHEYSGFYRCLAFHLCDTDAGAKTVAPEALIKDGQDVYIEATRSELLAAYVVLVAHPSDERYRSFFGTRIVSPVYGVEVPVLIHPTAEMGGGTGIAMCCTFDDTTDIGWWHDLELPLCTILRKDGHIQAETPEQTAPDGGRGALVKTAGKTTFNTREVMIARLRESSELRGKPVKAVRQTNFFGRGDKPLEIVTPRQWHIRNSSRPWTNPASRLDFNKKLVGRGHDLKFYPDFTWIHYENWATGPNNDWFIPRQRSFGVPFPLWYEVDENDEVDYSKVVTPREDTLPVGPSTDAPTGCFEEQRGKTGGFVGELDIMDTWTASSLSPELACD